MWEEEPEAIRQEYIEKYEADRAKYKSDMVEWRSKKQKPVIEPDASCIVNANRAAAAGQGRLQDWVQCDICQKWSELPEHMNPADLPHKWDCSMNTWNLNNSWCFKS